MTIPPSHLDIDMGRHFEGVEFRQAWFGKTRNQVSLSFCGS